ncbi:MAG: hypothetical protein V4724_01455 [Pseudomonadota bacterium]
MNNFIQISYALQRQKMAVERTLTAKSMDECVAASRWVDAWHRLIQSKLDQAPGAHGKRVRHYGLRRERVLH